MSDIQHIKTISDLQRFAGEQPLEHPSFMIIRMEDIPILPASYPRKMTYGFYNISLKRNLKGYINYGRTRYDFQEGVMGFTAPNQVIAYDPDIAEGATGWSLFFHAEYLGRHPLVDKIEDYGFFDYRINEALHLSQKEEDMMDQIAQNIEDEYHKPIDKHSQTVILSNLELLLTYADRYYSRQFITRNEVDSSFLSKFNKEIRRFFREEDFGYTGIPTVKYFASFMNVSQNYLSDVLRELTGKSTREHIHFHLIEKAKLLLLSSDQSISSIAFDLGFESPPYFTRFFKKNTGSTPKGYRSSN